MYRRAARRRRLGGAGLGRRDHSRGLSFRAEQARGGAGLLAPLAIAMETVARGPPGCASDRVAEGLRRRLALGAAAGWLGPIRAPGSIRPTSPYARPISTAVVGRAARVYVEGHRSWPTASS